MDISPFIPAGTEPWGLCMRRRVLMRRTTVHLWVLCFGLFLAQQVLVLALAQSEPAAQPPPISFVDEDGPLGPAL